jgi:hypothetical protein
VRQDVSLLGIGFFMGFFIGFLNLSTINFKVLVVVHFIRDNVEGHGTFVEDEDLEVVRLGRASHYCLSRLYDPSDSPPRFSLFLNTRHGYDGNSASSRNWRGNEPANSRHQAVSRYFKTRVRIK